MGASRKKYAYQRLNPLPLTVRKFYSLPVTDIQQFKTRLLSWSAQFSHCCYLDNNNYNTSYTSYECLIAAKAKQLLVADHSCFEQLKKFYHTQSDWLFGYFSYDLKNELEELTSNNTDRLQFPLLQFFVPHYLFRISGDVVEVGLLADDSILTIPEQLEALLSEITHYVSQVTSFDATTVQAKGSVNLQAKLTKAAYLESVNTLKQHIQAGDIYEVNFCQEFYAENAIIDPVEVYTQLNAISQAPFAAFCRFDDKYVICSSPERFLKKQGDKLVSQPIKGTAKRGHTPLTDEKLKQQLKQNTKEQNENVMIVDLVRNDLSRTAQRNSVQVEELFSIHTFKQVHQLISTVSSRLNPANHFTEAIKTCFPMGSMTGAPKISAMQLIERYEATRRGLYSGAIGYIDPQGNFDFNVVIRTILYHAGNNYLSFMAGSAITSQCSAEQEYEECLLKVQALIQALNNAIK